MHGPNRHTGTALPPPRRAVEQYRSRGVQHLAGRATTWGLCLLAVAALLAGTVVWRTADDVTSRSAAPNESTDTSPEPTSTTQTTVIPHPGVRATADPPGLEVADVHEALEGANYGVALGEHGQVVLFSAVTDEVVVAFGMSLDGHLASRRAALSRPRAEVVAVVQGEPPEDTLGLPTVQRLDLDDGSIVDVGPGDMPAISPDGRSLAYLTATRCPEACSRRDWDEVVVLDLEGGAELRWQLTDVSPAPLTGVAWSEEGSELYVARRNPGAYDGDGSETEPLLHRLPVGEDRSGSSDGAIESAPTVVLGPRTTPSTYNIVEPDLWYPIGVQRGRLLVVEEDHRSRLTTLGLLEVDLATGEQIAVHEQGPQAAGLWASVLFPALSSGQRGSFWYPPTYDERATPRAQALRGIGAVAF